MRTLLPWLVLVFTLLGAVVPASAGDPWPAAEPECRTAYGQTVCGYRCVAEYGQVQCAQTPYGLCRSGYGSVTCWDPPAASRRGRRDVDLSSWPAPTCHAEYGMVACGYTCESGYGTVQCTQTPYGVCHAEYGKVVCWDPPLHLVGVGQPRCLAGYGDIACGYTCHAEYGEVKCTQTPQGVCDAAYGKVVCWHPPAFVRTDARPTCKAEYGKLACGYTCRSGYGDVQCTQTPEGICTVGNGTVTCWDPPGQQRGHHGHRW